MKFERRASKVVVMVGFDVCLDALGLVNDVLVVKSRFWWCLKVFECGFMLLLCELSLLVFMDSSDFM